MTIKNLSAKPLSFQPVYLSTKGGEEPEDLISPLKQGEVSMHVCVCVLLGVGEWVRRMACGRVHVCVRVSTCPYKWEFACVCARGGRRTRSRSLVARVCVCVCVTVVGHDVNAVQEYEMPYPLQKDAGEEEDAWVLKDGRGVVVLKLRFEV